MPQKLPTSLLFEVGLLYWCMRSHAFHKHVKKRAARRTEFRGCVFFSPVGKVETPLSDAASMGTSRRVKAIVFAVCTCVLLAVECMYPTCFGEIRLGN